MLPKPEAACFLIADISGYTSFLNGAELDHAQDIIADVMGTVLRRLRPPFRLAKFEGDAAFVYALADKIDGSMLQDAIESAYFAFRKRLRNIKLSTSCECSACADMQRLDLKFVCHHGEFVKHKMAGREELAGRDVILVHRFLKNTVNERFGGHAYALYSDTCIQAMGIDPTVQGLVEHRETIDVIGEVKGWVRDLEQAWRVESERKPIEVTRKDALGVIECDIAAPRPTVWEYFILPGQRPKWRGSDEVRETVASGRRGTGTINHCIHGPDVFVEEVLDWRPFDYLTLTTLPPMPDAPKVLATYAFAEIAGGGNACGDPRRKAQAERGGVFHAVRADLAEDPRRRGREAQSDARLRHWPPCGDRRAILARIGAALCDPARPYGLTGHISRKIQVQRGGRSASEPTVPNYSKLFVKFPPNFRLFCQVFPNISLAILWNYKGLRRRNLLFASLFESPNF